MSDSAAGSSSSTTATAPPNDGRWTALVDGHVHLYDCHDRSAFLRGAFANFERARQQLRVSDAVGVLCFTEDRWHDAFTELQTMLERDGAALGFRAIASGETESFWIEAVNPPALESGAAARPGTLPSQPRPARVLVIAGQQVETVERLELLSLGTRARVPDGRSLTESVDAVLSSGGVPVLPWAFGKWWSARGRVIRAYLASDAAKTGAVLLGDNAGRPAGLPDPSPFRFMRKLGRAVLPGTDPLPLPDHAGRAGTYGFLIRDIASLGQPARGLRDALRLIDARSVVSFGPRCSWPGFVRDQIRLRTSPTVRKERTLPLQGRSA